MKTKYDEEEKQILLPNKQAEQMKNYQSYKVGTS